VPLDVHIQDGSADLGAGQESSTNTRALQPLTMGQEIDGVVEESRDRMARRIDGKEDWGFPWTDATAVSCAIVSMAIVKTLRHKSRFIGVAPHRRRCKSCVVP